MVAVKLLENSVTKETMQQPIGHMTNPQVVNTGSNSITTTTGTGVQRVFVQRDYRQGVAIRFVTEYPNELTGRLDRQMFEEIINQINQYFEDAERFDCSSFMESCCGFLTANLMFIFKTTRYEKCLKQVSKYVHSQNMNLYQYSGLKIVDPIERGLRCIEIDILPESPGRQEV